MRTRLLFALIGALAAVPAGANTDVEGPQSSGLNDDLASAQPIPTPRSTSSVTVFGWIDEQNENDVDFYRFTLPQGGAVVHFDVDFAEDAGASADLDEGLDPQLTIFGSQGRMIANNDDSDFFLIGPGTNDGTDPGSDPWADHDPFIGGLGLAAGTYYVAVSFYVNDPNAFDQQGLGVIGLSNSGVRFTNVAPDPTFDLSAFCISPIDQQCVGPYQLQLRLDFPGVSDGEGPVTSGQNDTAATAQALGTLQAEPNESLTTIGWIDENDENDVDFWRFTVADATNVKFDVDFAEDIRAPSDLDTGLDAEIWVFDSSDRLIANNDDSDFFGIGQLNAGSDPGSDPFADHDAFIGSLAMAPGDYSVAVAYRANDASAQSQNLSTRNLSISGRGFSGATPDAGFELAAFCLDPIGEQCVGTYQLQVRTLPEPGPKAAQLAAVLAVAGVCLLRRRRSA